MRGNGVKNIGASALLAAKTEFFAQGAMNRKKKLCWKCQEDKPVTGGHLKLRAGLHLFVCKDCLEAKTKDAP